MNLTSSSRSKAVLGALLIALVGLAPQGCASAKLTQEERTLYSQWLHDSHAPKLEGPWSPGLAFGLSALFPGLGHFYTVEISTGVLWSTFGLILWPFLVPAFSAYDNAEVFNRRSIARQYEDWLTTQKELNEQLEPEADSR